MPSIARLRKTRATSEVEALLGSPVSRISFVRITYSGCQWPVPERFCSRDGLGLG